eukprot:Nitzschia sp. Nitz4//scaffold119_size111653//57019//57582//NITZ4_004194-RA/size111653-processed-gene-0.169-mRNA-1//1//CDS//3329533848//6285//frame0
MKTCQEVHADATVRMDKSIGSLVENLGTVRTGRASSHILDRVRCDNYGVLSPINQMATIQVASAQQLNVKPYDKQNLEPIAKAIREAELGLSPQVQDGMLRITIPSLNEERRKEMLKQCKALAEEGKVAIRNIRRKCIDAIKKLEKGGKLSKDGSRDGQAEIQTLTDKKIQEIENMATKKEKELLRI